MIWSLWRVGYHWCMNLTNVTCCVKVFLRIAFLCADQSTKRNCAVDHLVFSMMYAYNRGPWRSFIICRFSLEVLMIPPGLKTAPTIAGTNIVDFGRKLS